MTFFWGILAIVGALAIQVLVKAMRRRYARAKKKAEGWGPKAERRERPRNERDIIAHPDSEEDFLAEYSPQWLNLAALLPLPLILIGIVLVFRGVFGISTAWIRYSVVYGLVGFCLAMIQIGRGKFGTAGAMSTLVSYMILWPIILAFLLNMSLWNRRMR